MTRGLAQVAATGGGGALGHAGAAEGRHGPAAGWAAPPKLALRGPVAAAQASGAAQAGPEAGAQAGARAGAQAGLPVSAQAAVAEPAARGPARSAAHARGDALTPQTEPTPPPAQAAARAPAQPYAMAPAQPLALAPAAGTLPYGPVPRGAASHARHDAPAGWQHDPARDTRPEPCAEPRTELRTDSRTGPRPDSHTDTASHTGAPGATPVRYTAILGGTFTFGPGVTQPYPALLEAALGQPVLNLGARNAGIEAALRDEGMLRLGAGAARVVVQITGAHALSNPFYRVHPRRNDRLIGPTEALRRLYPEVDFTPIAFTGHLLAALAACDGDPAPDAPDSRFGQVVAALRATWVARMQVLLRTLGPGRATLLWVGPPPPGLLEGTPAAVLAAPPRWPAPEPAFITAGMLAPLRPLAARLVVVPPGHAARLPGAQSQVHRRVADTLVAVLRG